MEKLKEYLNAYAHVYKGHYLPVDCSMMWENFWEEVGKDYEVETKVFIERFKEFCSKGLPFFAIGIFPDYEKELFDKNMKIVTEYESKHPELFK